MAKAIQEKTRSTFKSLLRKNISRWNKPREKQMLPTNMNAKEKRVIKIFLQHYQLLWNKFIWESVASLPDADPNLAERKKNTSPPPEADRQSI